MLWNIWRMQNVVLTQNSLKMIVLVTARRTLSSSYFDILLAQQVTHPHAFAPMQTLSRVLKISRSAELPRKLLSWTNVVLDVCKDSRRRHYLLIGSSLPLIVWDFGCFHWVAPHARRSWGGDGEHGGFKAELCGRRKSELLYVSGLQHSSIRFCSAPQQLLVRVRHFSSRKVIRYFSLTW